MYLEVAQILRHSSYAGVATKDYIATRIQPTTRLSIVKSCGEMYCGHHIIVNFQTGRANEKGERNRIPLVMLPLATHATWVYG